jgi:chromosome transmission fidelity protein 1
MLFSHELITEGEFFNIDLESIIKFCDLTCLPDKVHGFIQRYGNEEPAVKLKTVGNSMKSFLKKMESQKQSLGNIQAAPAEVVVERKKTEPPSTNAIRPLIAFLKCLIENYDDGRILISQKTSVKYLLLNPGARFDDILSECRSLILAGGTMKPTDELTGQLFSHCPDRVKIYR